MFCPICKAEYKSEFTLCGFCHVPLVQELPIDSIVLRVPRPFGMIVPYMIAFFLLNTLLLISAAFLIKSILPHMSPNLTFELIMFISAIVLFVVVKLDFLYVPSRYIACVFLDKKRNILRVTQGETVVREIDLRDVKNFLLKRIRLHRCPQCKFALVRNDGSSVDIYFDDFLYWGGSGWETFSEKVAIFFGKPLKKET